MPSSELCGASAQRDQAVGSVETRWSILIRPCPDHKVSTRVPGGNARRHHPSASKHIFASTAQLSDNLPSLYKIERDVSRVGQMDFPVREPVPKPQMPVPCPRLNS